MKETFPQPPPRGFPTAAYAHRVTDMQRRMAAAQVDALILTTAAEFAYFSGFCTQFWESPTRPWFLLLPADGKPIAIIPDIGEAAMRDTWLDDVRCWPSPRPADDGISLLATAAGDAAKQHGQIGMALGTQSAIRMPINDWRKLTEAVRPAVVIDVSDILQAQRMIKSPQEVEKIRHAAAVTSAAFTALPAIAAAGWSEREICLLLRQDILRRGGDYLPYLAAASGVGGYEKIIMPPTDKIPRPGDILFIDTGTVFDHYFCDFNRNYAIDNPAESAQQAHRLLYDAVSAGAVAARPGVRASEVWRAMREVLGVAGGDGRMGHGIGLQLTEPPSLAPDDHTVLAAGMTLAIEPSMTTKDGAILVREENILLTDDGVLWLSTRAAPELPILSAADK